MPELGKVAAKEVDASLDWLGRGQPFIEVTLAPPPQGWRAAALRRHLQLVDGTGKRLGVSPWVDLLRQFSRF
jgi:hypothetical protein